MIKDNKINTPPSRPTTAPGWEQRGYQPRPINEGYKPKPNPQQAIPTNLPNQGSSGKK